MVVRRKSEEEWKELISDQKESSQSALGWCEKNGVNYNTFIMRQMQLKNKTVEPSLDPTHFRELQVISLSQFVEFVHRETTLRILGTVDKKLVRHSIF